MSDVQITLTIPEKLAKNAEEFGLLTPIHLVALLEAEVELKAAAFAAEAADEQDAERRESQRDAAIHKARAMLEKLDALEPKMTWEEIEQEIHAARKTR